MARFGLAARAARRCAILILGVGVLGACQSGAPTPVRDANGEPVIEALPCAEDEVREYFCDDLMPRSSSRPAPAPYDNCPASSDVRHGNYEAVSRVASFDQPFTDYTRRRVQPGHSCCYGWCAKAKVADPSIAAPVACQGLSEMHWGFCMRELEGGTSVPSASPYERCPAAVTPPEAVAFSAPPSAALDWAETGRRRQEKQLAECCYGWCTRMPAGTVLKSSQPKIK
jgi:hypothetical protein